MNKKKDLMKVNNKKSLTFSVPSVPSVVKILLFFSSSLFLFFSLLTSHLLPITHHPSRITIHQSPITILNYILCALCALCGKNSSLFFPPFSPLTIHHSPFTTHHSPITNHHLQFPIFAFSHLRIFLPFSLLTSHFSLLTSHFSLLTSHQVIYGYRKNQEDKEDEKIY